MSIKTTGKIKSKVQLLKDIENNEKKEAPRVVFVPGSYLDIDITYPINQERMRQKYVSLHVNEEGKEVLTIQSSMNFEPSEVDPFLERMSNYSSGIS